MIAVVPTKDAHGENFPVGSLLISARLRPVVAAYYRFARMADDIADAPELPEAEKTARLNALRAALKGEGDIPEARELAPILQTHGVPLEHADDLLTAFLRDAANQSCATWADLIDYCRHSAAPVGRFLLDLHQEPPHTRWPGDALCAALQILNHVQDCGKDWLALKRCYMPTEWLQAEGIDCEALTAQAASPALRKVLNRVLEGTDGLLLEASTLLRTVQNLRLRMEVGVIYHLARRLRELLRTGDPLAGRVELKPGDWAMAAIQGLCSALRRKP